MQLDLQNLEEGRLRRVFAIDADHPVVRRLDADHPVVQGLDAEVREPVSLDVELTNPAAGTYVMTAELSGEVIEPCRRCLEPVEVELDERFRVVYRERSRDLEDEETGDEDLILVERGVNEIEIDREVRDRLFLEVDRFPVCRRDCEGICPKCGQNWNEGDCECEFDEVDSRWKALEEIRSGMETG